MQDQLTRKITVLLIDDEDDFRELAEKRLKKRGFAVCTAAGCQEAMACLDSSCPPDVVILDLNMPKVNGLQCLHYIKEKQPQVPVIMLTGHASVDTGVEGIRLGAFDYCLKPIELEELLEKIHLAIRSA
ncbi:MAG: hypothetical protein A2521_14465 [Deltaproteobacteria bacterium RIFOXYD12_FULL_57_12]|nr:MAG: hypothetical protein A2521_14465 [Deltaproteobacteria bacterium RIFOXYD12_FULL_57_12]